MRTAHFKRMARLGTGALVLLVFQVCYAPRSAWAGCSHLVGSRADQVLDLNRLDLLMVSESGQKPNEPPAPGRHAPCSGLSCSSRDSLPVSAAVPRLDGSSEQWCALDALVVPNATSRPRITLEEPSLISLGEPSSIFHPPRI